MVVGIEKFREKLGAYSESYIIIGGTACDLILSRLQYEPRATVDIADELIGGMKGIFNF